MSVTQRVVLVTGARGFLGAPCLRRLAARGFAIVAVTSAPPPPDAPGLRWRRCNLLDPAAGSALVAANRPSHLLHLAWCAKPGEFWASEENFSWLSGSQAL